MSEQYYLDFEQYTLEKLKESIAKRELIPSRVILKELIDERFAALSRCNIHHLKDLETRCKSKDKIEQFSRECSLSVEYLTILKREVSSYRPNPVPLAKFPGVDKTTLEALEAVGIKHSKQLFTETKIKSTSRKLADSIGIAIEKLEELVSLADLARLYGVGPVFARMIYNAGVRSVQDFVIRSGDEFIALYEKNTGKKADFSSTDIDFSLELARELLHT